MIYNKNNKYKIYINYILKKIKIIIIKILNIIYIYKYIYKYIFIRYIYFFKIY